jgi:hypothetical protein
MVKVKEILKVIHEEKLKGNQVKAEVLGINV